MPLPTHDALPTTCAPDYDAYKASLRAAWEGSRLPEQVTSAGVTAMCEPVPEDLATAEFLAKVQQAQDTLFGHMGVPADVLAESYDGRCFY
jgi:hypothetical protein